MLHVVAWNVPYAATTNRQLAQVRKGQKDQESGGARVVEAEKKLIICAVKKPLKLSESPDGERRVRWYPHGASVQRPYQCHSCIKLVRLIPHLLWITFGAHLLFHADDCNLNGDLSVLFPTIIECTVVMVGTGSGSRHGCRSIYVSSSQPTRATQPDTVPRFRISANVVSIIQEYKISMGGFKSAIDSLIPSNRCVEDGCCMNLTSYWFVT